MSTESKPLSGKVALVTGASRGIGKGIALQLGQAGATVYITGRTLKSSNGSFGSLEDTANEIRERGGECFPIQCDHEKDTDIAHLFERIEKDQNGQLDILVNNAYKAVDTIFNTAGKRFWEHKPEIWDDVNNVGLRNHYFCTVYASRLMVPRKSGLIVNITSFGGSQYLFNCAYGIGKCAVDRMANDCGIELRKHGITMIALSPGAVKTELCTNLAAENSVKVGGKEISAKEVFNNGESIEFAGKILVALFQDPKLKSYTRKVIFTADYGYQHSIRDIDNRVIPSVRDVKDLLKFVLPKSLLFLTDYIPTWVKIPYFLLTLNSSKY